MLLGMPPNADLFRAAGEAARHPEITGDALVTADYRRQLAAVMVRRSLTNAHQRAVRAMNQEHHHV
jgi:CO/xanthine dehydrogenase FAD-binding subunit